MNTDRASPRASGSRAARRKTRIWLFVALVMAGSLGLTWMMSDWGPLLSRPTVPWPALVGAFALSEHLVFHLRLRQDAHSFSMSEIPLVIALFLASPFAAITAQVAGNIVVLALLRRQVLVKAVFNVAQFAMQTALAVLVFRTLAGLGDPLGLAGWVGALAAALVALAVADLLIAVVIHLSGGKLSHTEMASVLGLSSLAAVMNTALSLVAVTLMVVRPASAWLAFAPPAALYVAYRGYIGKREEGERLEALYDATRALHASPQIDSALEAAVDRARNMVDAEYAEILLFPAGTDSSPLRTSVGPGTASTSMESVDNASAQAMRYLLSRARDGLYRGDSGMSVAKGSVEIREAIVAPLISSDVVAGLLVAVNRLGDISSFDQHDVRLLETVASQVAVSLRNGRLEDSLTQLTELKDQLEGLVRSKDQLVASVSHELRTPLTAIVGLAQELRDNRATFSDTEADELIAVIAEQGGDLANIVDDLLVAAHADGGELSLHREEFDLTRELSMLASSFETADRFGSITIDVAPQCESVYADMMRVRQIIRNLITNAERYGGDKMWIEVRPRRQQTVIAVIDDGDGVPPSDAETIFEPYRRSEAGVQQPLSVGLGLAVSRKLARLMDGDLRYVRADGLTRFELIITAHAPVGEPQR